MTLRRAIEIADLVLKGVTIIALMVGGTWTFWTFVIQRTDVENLGLEVTAESVRYGGDLRLLVVHVKPKNIGKVLAQPTTFRLIVRKIPPGIEQGKTIELAEIKPMASIDLLRHDQDGYEMEPGVGYDDVEVLVVQKGIVVHVEAELEFQDGSVILARTVQAIQ